MQIVLSPLFLIAATLFVIGSYVAWVGISNAPEGFEDAEGFHFDRPPHRSLKSRSTSRVFAKAASPRAVKVRKPLPAELVS